MLEDMIGPGEARTIQLDRTLMEQALIGDRNFSISCELPYPSLRAMMNRADLHLRYSVRFYLYEILILCYVYVVYIPYTFIDIQLIYRVYNMYIPYKFIDIMIIY